MKGTACNRLSVNLIRFEHVDKSHSGKNGRIQHDGEGYQGDGNQDDTQLPACRKGYGRRSDGQILLSFFHYQTNLIGWNGISIEEQEEKGCGKGEGKGREKGREK